MTKKIPKKLNIHVNQVEVESSNDYFFRKLLSVTKTLIEIQGKPPKINISDSVLDKLFEKVESLVQSREPYSPEENFLSQLTEFFTRHIFGGPPDAGVPSVRRLPEYGGPRNDPVIRDISRPAVLLIQLLFTCNNKIDLSKHLTPLNSILSNDISLLDGPLSILKKNPDLIEFEQKIMYLRHNLIENENGILELFQIDVRRDQILLDTFNTLSHIKNSNFGRYRLKIEFIGEEGIDATGLTREFFHELTREFINPNYALLSLSDEENVYMPNVLSSINDHHLSYFKMMGLIIAKAIWDKIPLDLYFTRSFYKLILSRRLTLQDMEQTDLSYFRSLVYVLENPVEDLEMCFSIEVDNFGDRKIYDLKENGRNIPVTDENKKEFVDLVTQFKMKEVIKEQVEAFNEGFYSIIPHKVIQIFDFKEIELLIAGLPFVDIEDLKVNSRLEGFKESDKQVKWFWEIIGEYNEEDKAKMLQFVTGTSKVPLGGFSQLHGMTGINLFTLRRQGDIDSLPSAQTCLNILNIPPYPDKELMKNKLEFAINETRGFGFR